MAVDPPSRLRFIENPFPDEIPPQIRHDLSLRFLLPDFWRDGVDDFMEREGLGSLPLIAPHRKLDRLFAESCVEIQPSEEGNFLLENRFRL